jgi:CRISPR-associated endonuclease/helicase Cas3
MVIGHHKSIKAISSDKNQRGIIDLVNRFGDGEIFKRHSEYWQGWYILAKDFLNYFGYETNEINLINAEKSFNYTVDYCDQEILGWSKYRGLLMASDHFASAMAYDTEQYICKAFEKPKLDFFFNKNRESLLYPLSKFNTTDSRQHTIVIAPTGAGKTDFLIKRCKNRIFYTLPFQASINAMYKRLIETCPTDDVRVLHSASKLIIDSENRITEEKTLQSLSGSSIKVLTPYQIAGIALGTSGYESIALDLMGNDVILDEIHTYSENSMSILYEIIKMLIHLKCRIHIGSATFPTSLQRVIKDLLGGEKNIYEIKLSDYILQSFNRHVIHKIDSFDDSIEIITEGLKKSEKILIVCNRIKTAQQRFELLSELFPNTKMMLLHSRFKRKDRAELEDKIKKEFDEIDEPCIVVSTQVVEVSLDISFDKLITDAAPIDSLIQRFGRVNRRREETTIGKFKHVHIIKNSDKKVDTLPYNYETVVASFNVLPDNGVLQETNIQQLIDEVYKDVNIGSLKSHSIINEYGFTIPKLCNIPKSVLLDALEINSASCIVASDEENYILAKGDNKRLFEIPISYQTIYNKNFSKIKQLECGSWPFVVADELYDSIKGLGINLTSNIL